MPTIGEMMARRAAYNQARIDASLVIGSGLFLLSDRDVEVPLTGVRISKPRWGTSWGAR